MLGLLKVYGVVLVLILFSNGICASKSFVPTTVLLNDTITSNHFYICTYGYLGPSSILSVPTTVLIDVRDLLADNTPESTVIDEVNNRITYVKQSFSQAVKATKAFSLLMVEDKTGVYGIASKMGISVILAEANDIKEIAKPDLDSVDYVFFVSKKTLQNIFHQVKMDSPSGLLMDFSEPLPVGVGYGILAFSILKLLSLTSIAAAGLIVIKNHEELLLLVHKTRPNSRANPFLKAIVPALFILCVISLILLAYFFFDIMVYFFIAVFVVAGASAMSFFVAVFLFMKAPALKRITFRIRKLDISALRCILFFMFLSFTISWCVFRNDPSIGWIMQDIIGVFLIIQILTDVSILMSFKTICVCFLILICYDVFFVFISPFIVSSSSSSTAAASKPEAHQSPVESGPSVFPPNIQHEVLSRGRRGLANPGTSIMEAVATGSVGSSGELMPLVFKVSLATFGNPSFACQNNRDYAVLGFGDAILPGILCVFLAFYDTCWQRKVPWNFICALSGYVLGGLVVSIALFSTKMAQPALLYLCPLTLGTTVLCAYCRGGITELRNLWSGGLPTPTHVHDDNSTAAGVVSEVIYRLPGEERTLSSSSAGNKSVNEGTHASSLNVGGAYHQDRFLNI